MGAVRDLEASGLDIRRAFARMGFNDTESVSLIGGGHAFGKAHGDPNGTLPLGGVMTSGFEGAWTTTPTKWSNEFFRNLFELDFLESESPAGEYVVLHRTLSAAVPLYSVLTTNFFSGPNGHPQTAPTL